MLTEAQQKQLCYLAMTRAVAAELRMRIFIARPLCAVCKLGAAVHDATGVRQTWVGYRIGCSIEERENPIWRFA
jgi:hypothetical protein